MSVAVDTRHYACGVSTSRAACDAKPPGSYSYQYVSQAKFVMASALDGVDHIADVRA